jgi:hypothetical protein
MLMLELVIFGLNHSKNLAWVYVSIWLEAEVDGRNSGIEGEDGMVGAGTQDLDHVLNALPRLTNTCVILIWTVPKCGPLTFLM